VGQLRPEQVGSVLLTYVALPLCILVPVAIYLLRRIDARFVAILGLTAFAIAGWMVTGITHEWRLGDVIPIALVQSVAQAFTFTGLLIFSISNSDPARSTAFAAYICVTRSDAIELTSSMMTTLLRGREQVHSNLIGLHVSVADSAIAQTATRLGGKFHFHLAGLQLAIGDSETAQTLGHLIDHFVGYSADTATTVARATAIMGSVVRREANVLSFMDGFELAFWAAIFGLLLISLTRAAPPRPLAPASSK